MKKQINIEEMELNIECKVKWNKNQNYVLHYNHPSK